MRWSIIRTIWFREMRDQMRDRRTLFMILGLPLLLYPILGAGVLRFALDFTETPSLIGVVLESTAEKDFPGRVPPFAGRSVLPSLACLSATGLPGTEITAWGLTFAGQLALDYPLLIRDGHFTTFDRKVSRKLAREYMEQSRLRLVFLDTADAQALDQHKVDLILKAPQNFYAELEKGDVFSSTVRPQLEIQGRRDDEKSRLALRRLTPLLDVWKQELKKTRQTRMGLPDSLFEPLEIRYPIESEGSGGHGVLDLVVRVFPFMLVMWSLAGALYPAVDLCAGEKERGTMETLLITPAGREEIVLGKFLTIWVFSSASALLNLLSMGVTTTQFSEYLPQGGLSVAALMWCLVLALPQSAFFSAISLAIGAYARSSKEGQYYLMPLFLVTMPLIFMTLAPGVELNAFYSMVPVTGVALLMQRLMTANTLGDIPWAYFIPVLAPMALYSWLALRWAIEQFNREEVLFREAERLDVLLWLKRLFREKEPLPTTGQAFFCVALLIGLHWISRGLGDRWSLEIHTVISQLAFVATPALFMVLLLNSRPAEALYLRRPSGREAILAAILAVLFLPPMVGLAQAVALWVPNLLEGKHPLIGILQAIHAGGDLSTRQAFSYLLAFALVPAVCEEIAFRGFVLQGLRQGFRPRNAVLLSAFFFALFHMNVFLFLPTFVLGVILGLLTLRSRSLLPAALFHFLHNASLVGLILLPRWSDASTSLIEQPLWAGAIAVCFLTACGVVWWLYRKPYIDLARREAIEAERIRREISTP